MGIRSDSKTVVDMINGKSRQKVGVGVSWRYPKTTEGMVGQGGQFEKKGGRLGGVHLL